MIWCGISANCRTRPILLIGKIDARKYISDVITNEVLPFLTENPNVVAFQQDNAPPHTANITKQFLRDNGLPTLPWPAMSPDLNPIEHVWDAMKRKIRQKNPKNLTQLAQEIVTAWTELPQHFIQKLIYSMPRRVEMCIRNFGGHTGY